MVIDSNTNTESDMNATTCHKREVYTVEEAIIRVGLLEAVYILKALTNHYHEVLCQLI